MDAEDKRFVNEHMPPETNRKKLSENGKAIIIGTNYKIPPELFTPLSERFEVKDLSKSEIEINAAATPAKQ